MERLSVSESISKRWTVLKTEDVGGPSNCRELNQRDSDSLVCLKGYFMLKISPLTDFRVLDRTWNLFALPVVVKEQEVIVN